MTDANKYLNNRFNECVAINIVIPQYKGCYDVYYLYNKETARKKKLNSILDKDKKIELGNLEEFNILFSLNVEYKIINYDYRLFSIIEDKFGITEVEMNILVEELFNLEGYSSCSELNDYVYINDKLDKAIVL